MYAAIFFSRGRGLPSALVSVYFPLTIITCSSDNDAISVYYYYHRYRRPVVAFDNIGEDLFIYLF